MRARLACRARLPPSLVVPAPLPQAPKRHILRRRRQRSRSRPAAEIARALCEYGVPVELVACEPLGELAAALEARAGGAAVSGRKLILSAGERAALLAALRRRHRPHGPATAATAVVALEHAEPVRGGYPVLLPDEGRALLDELRRREGEMRSRLAELIGPRGRASAPAYDQGVPGPSAGASRSPARAPRAG